MFLYRLEAYVSSSGILGMSVSGRVVDAKKIGARINVRNDCLKNLMVREDGKSRMTGMEVLSMWRRHNRSRDGRRRLKR